ncbi:MULTISPECIES: transketolase family protein [Pseudomonas]|uniref:Transketolase, alpha subunit n=1 Tax=Pseudomonas asplenii TaxID=53407 RepID=A0A0N0VJN8_9PSED|nr:MULTISPECIES: transketolase C-terminal domain-containing protein [Pseudomonas]KPA90021.1 transketolase, alpha subunit [Pseudomonas fuscovaginae]KPA94791.1 transketolase, alpha subunit [Pseudomonas fuscovaginae]
MSDTLQSIKPRAMRDTLLASIVEAMEADDDIFFATADFGSPVLDQIRERYPQRFVNVGIAEQNLINVSAGLALEGFKVFAYAIAPFITMRCFEQIRVNLALLSTVRPMNVNLIGVGAGYSYVVSGPTHQCYEDLTLMRSLPNMQVLSPADQVTSAALASRCLERPGIKYLRLDAQVLPVVYTQGAPDLARGFQVHGDGDALCLVSTGYMTQTALKAAERLASDGLRVTVVDLFDLSGFDEQALITLFARFRGVVSLEEGFEGRGGLDALLFNLLARRLPETRLFNVGVAPQYRFELGERTALHEQVGIGVDAVTHKVRDFHASLSL